MLQLCVCRDIEHLGGLESTQESRVALGCASLNISYPSIRVKYQTQPNTPLISGPFLAWFV